MDRRIPRKAPTPEPLSAGSGRYIRPLWILAGYPPNRTVRATKCPQIATKWRLSATVRSRTGDEPQLRHRSAPSGVSRRVSRSGPSRSSSCAQTPDSQATVTTPSRSETGGRRRRPLAGDLLPGRLDLGEEGGGATSGRTLSRALRVGGGGVSFGAPADAPGRGDYGIDDRVEGACALGVSSRQAVEPPSRSMPCRTATAGSTAHGRSPRGSTRRRRACRARGRARWS